MKNKISFYVGWALGAGLLLSCGSSKSPSDSPRERFQYGNKILPGKLTGLPADYRPASLNNKSFTFDGHDLSPMDLDTEWLTLTFDLQAHTVRAHAVLTFHQNVAAEPFFQLEASPQNARLWLNLICC